MNDEDVVPVQEDAQAVEPAQESAPEQTQEAEKARDDKGRFVPQERVNEITKARREAERALESERQRTAALEAQLYQQQPAPNVSEAPSLEQYNFDVDAWGKAMAEHAVVRAQSVYHEQAAQYQRAQSQQALAKTFDERANKYAVEHPDFADDISRLGSVVRFSPEVVETIGYSEHGPAVAHYLAQNLDIADRISRMPAHIAAAQLGRIEAQVSAPKAKPITNAPSPVPTVGAGARSQKDPDAMTTTEWLKWREKQLENRYI
jgi:hypothetical protein